LIPSAPTTSRCRVRRDLGPPVDLTDRDHRISERHRGVGERGVQNLVQVGATNGIVRSAEARHRLLAQGLARAQPTRPVTDHPAFQRDGGCLQLVGQTQPVQDLGGVGGELQPAADVGERRRLFDDLRGDAPLSQAQGKAQAGDAATDDGDRARLDRFAARVVTHHCSDQ
jgi:hypothetical protein